MNGSIPTWLKRSDPKEIYDENSLSYSYSGLRNCKPLAHAGIPVAVDADPMRDVQWAQELKRWMETARHYQSQIQAYKDQLATATGVRDIADFVDQAKGLKADLESCVSPDRH